MNRFNKILVMIFSLAFLMSACNEDDAPPGKVQEDPYFKYEGGTDIWLPYQKGYTIIPVVDVNRTYYAKVAEGGEWCTVTDIAVNSFIINYEELKKAADRSTRITLSMEGVEDINLVVTQRGADPILVVDSTKFLEVSAPYMGVDTTIFINVNGAYEVEVEAGKEWCSVVAENMTDEDFQFAGLDKTVPHRFKLNIAQNNELESRSAKVTVSLSYQDSTSRFEFVVNQLPTPILLNLPEDGTIISKDNGFPYTFSWNKTGGLSSYSIAVSTDSNFPEDATSVINVGDVDNYALKLTDIVELIKLSYRGSVPLYWKVMPTDPSINIATETKLFYVQRKVIASYPLTFNTSPSWGTYYTDPDGTPRIYMNGGRNGGRRVFVATNALTTSITGTGIETGTALVLAYEYKTSYIPPFIIPNTNPPAIKVRYNSTAAYNGPLIDEQTMPLTEEYQPMHADIQSSHNWGQQGNQICFWFNAIDYLAVPSGALDPLVGLSCHIKNLRIDVYE
jgi:hypothetical protein